MSSWKTNVEAGRFAWFTRFPLEYGRHAYLTAFTFSPDSGIIILLPLIIAWISLKMPSWPAISNSLIGSPSAVFSFRAWLNISSTDCGFRLIL